MAVLWLAIFYAAKIAKTSEKHEVYFNVFHSEYKMSSPFTAKIAKTSQSLYKRVNKSLLLFSRSATELGRSQIISSLLEYFTASAKCFVCVLLCIRLIETFMLLF